MALIAITAKNREIFGLDANAAKTMAQEIIIKFTRSPVITDIIAVKSIISPAGMATALLLNTATAARKTSAGNPALAR